jgi:hypothetical protein
VSIKDSILNLQYQYSKIFTLGLKRKKFTIRVTESGIEAENNSRNTFISLLFTLFSCGLLFSGIIEAFVNGNKITLEFVLVFWVVHIMVGLIGLRQFLWLVNGTHHLRIKDCILTLDKSGTFLTRPKKFNLNEIERLAPSLNEEEMNLFDRIQNNIRLNHRLLFRHTYGQVTFDYKGKTIHVFSDLTKIEKVELTEKIEKELKNCHQQLSPNDAD